MEIALWSGIAACGLDLHGAVGDSKFFDGGAGLPENVLLINYRFIKRQVRGQACPVESVYFIGLLNVYAYRSHAWLFPAPGMIVSACANLPKAGSYHLAL